MNLFGEDENKITPSDLEKYGRVVVCAEIAGQFHVQIKEGFDPSVVNTSALIKRISESVPQYPTIHKVETSKGNFILILKPKK
jgi:hypothetical protein